MISEYTFDGILDTSATQESSFSMAALPIIDIFVTGSNGLIMAYGETGSGKTHTMLGDGCLKR